MASLPLESFYLDIVTNSCPPTPFLLSLTHNSFSFNSLHYLQVKGTAMGNKIIPSHANLFKGNLEEEYLKLEDSKPA